MYGEKKGRISTRSSLRDIEKRMNKEKIKRKGMEEK
jgi:hypothetical protein